MDIPNASSHFDVTKRGFLQKLSSRSFPYIPHPWKRKYCILVKGQLFYYEKEDSRGADKGSGVINLEYYDQVVEAPPKECKKATHVFVLTSQDRSFFDPGRHLFSAETNQSMLEWMRLLKRAIEQIRNNNRTTPAVGVAAGSSSNPSSPRQKPEASKPDVRGLSKVSAASKLEVNSKDKGKKKESEEEADTEVNRRRKATAEEYSAKGAADNKENLEDWTISKEKKTEIL